MGILTKISNDVFVSVGKKQRALVHEQSRDPRAAQEELLMGLVRENEATEFGRAHGFAQIETARQYRERVPLTTYADYAEPIERMLAGESNVLQAKDPEVFSATSGSVGVPKHIPQSKAMMGVHFSCELAYAYAVIDDYLRGKGQRLSSDLAYIFLETKVTYDAKGRPKGSGSGMYMLKMRPLLKYLYATPEEAIFRDEETDASYLHARFMLTSPKVSALTSTFATMILYVFVYMERNIDMLVEDIRTGTINDEVKISDDARASVMKRIKPMPERAEEIRRAFEKVDTEPVVPKLWPGLQFVYAIGTGGFATHSEMLRRYTGPVPFDNVTLSASEGLFGVADGVEETSFLMTTTAGYFEFIPLEHAYDENPPTLDVAQLELNHEYETVITNLSGFYRYRMGDVVEVTDFYNKTPKVEFRYRLGQVINMAGEKTNMRHLKWSVERLQEETGLEVIEYAIQAITDEYPNRYKLYLEPVESRYDRPLSAYARILEEAMEKANPSYGAKVQKGMFAPLELVFNQPQTHVLYREMMAHKNGTAAPQIKPVSLIDNPIKERFFGALVDELPEG